MATNPHLQSVLSLSPAEKLQLVHDLWDNLAEDADQLPVYEWQKQELLKRRAELAEHPDRVVTWEDAKRIVRGGQDG